MSTAYTDDDVQVARAALHASWEASPTERDAGTEELEAILDAVAPRIAARAKVEALREFADSMRAVSEGHSRFPTDRRAPKFAALWADARADRLERP